jgi:heat shock protein HtpX
VIAAVIAGVVGFFAELLFRSFFNFGYGWGYGGGSWSTSSSSSSQSSSSDSGGGSDRKSGGGAILIIILAVVLIALAWALSQLVRLALSRSRELLADAGSVELTKNPDAMISALRKIEGRGELPGATSAVMELCLDNPREGFSDLFATHPSVEARVQALVKYAGGHYQGPLALPMHPSGEPDDQPDQPESRQVPPPLPSGASLNASSVPSSSPWGSATDPAAASPSAPDGPWGNHPAGPWGRR